MLEQLLTEKAEAQQNFNQVQKQSSDHLKMHRGKPLAGCHKCVNNVNNFRLAKQDLQEITTDIQATTSPEE